MFKKKEKRVFEKYPLAFDINLTRNKKLKKNKNGKINTNSEFKNKILITRAIVLIFYKATFFRRFFFFFFFLIKFKT